MLERFIGVVGKTNDYMVLVSGWCGGVCVGRGESDLALLPRIDVGDIFRSVRKVDETLVCILSWRYPGFLPLSNEFCGPKVMWIQLSWMLGSCRKRVWSCLNKVARVGETGLFQ